MASQVQQNPQFRQQSLSPAHDQAALEASRSNGTASSNPGAPQKEGPRRTSFNFLRRQKSSEAKQSSNAPKSGPNNMSGKMSKKQRAVAQEELARQQREAAALGRSPPRLPTHSPLPTINAFGGAQGGDTRPDSVAIATNRYPQGQLGSPAAQGRQQGAGGAGYHAVSSHVPIPPIPQGPASSPVSRNGEYDPYSRSESMTHRGRYSYASSAVSMGTLNSPRRVRRRRDPTPFNILVVGAKNSGKTSFINFLRSSLGTAKKSRHGESPPRSGTALRPDSPFTSQYLETEIDHERIGVTLWDSQGFERNIVDLQLREMSSFLESKFEETFTEEQKVIRAPGVRDTHIHCVFLVLDPIRLDANVAASRQGQTGGQKYAEGPRLVGGLDEDLDLQVLRTLQGKTTVIPIISKADTITTAHMSFLKRTVWNSLKQAKIDPLEALNIAESSEEDSERGDFDERDEDRYVQAADENGSPRSKSNRRHTARDEEVVNNIADPDSASESERETGPGARSSSPNQAAGTSPATPQSSRNQQPRAASAMAQAAEDEMIIPLSILSPDTYDLESSPPGRRFPWGFADPYNEDHCDFVRLKDSVFSEWRAELREASRELWYEGWRTSRLRRHDATPQRPVTVGTAGRTTDSGMRSPTGRPQPMYGAPAPNGKAMSATTSPGQGRDYGSPGMAI